MNNWSRQIAAVLVAGLGIVAVAGTAQADERHDMHGRNDRHGPPPRHYHRPPPPRYYRPPPVVVEQPAPGYYAPPVVAPQPGFNIVIPIR